MVSLSEINPKVLLIWLGYFVAVVVLVFLSLMFRRQKKNRLSLLLFCAGVFCFMRFLVFYNPYVMFFLNSKLGEEDLTRRTKHSIQATSAYNLKKEKRPFLIVGSSQARMLFGSYAWSNQSVHLFWEVGMGPLDYFLNESYIEDYQPDCVVMYLSDFDLGRYPSLIRAMLAPAQPPWTLWKLWRILSENTQIGPKEYLLFCISNQVPEYGYRFLFQGLVDKLCRRRLVYGTGERETIADPNLVDVQLKRLNNLDPGQFQVNIELLKAFAAWCGDRGLKLAVVEGHYLPAGIEQNRDRHIRAREMIRNTLKPFDNAWFIPYDMLEPLRSEDYVDAYHVSEEAGYRFSTRLFQILPEHILKN